MKFLFDMFQLAMVLAFVGLAFMKEFEYSVYAGLFYCITMLAEIKYGERRRKKILLKDGSYGFGRKGEPKP